MHGIFFSVWFVYFQEEQQQLGLQFLIKRVWVAFCLVFMKLLICNLMCVGRITGVPQMFLLQLLFSYRL
jgi:hypothetical protein